MGDSKALPILGGVLLVLLLPLLIVLALIVGMDMQLLAVGVVRLNKGPRTNDKARRGRSPCLTGYC